MRPGKIQNPILLPHACVLNNGIVCLDGWPHEWNDLATIIHHFFVCNFEATAFHSLHFFVRVAVLFLMLLRVAARGSLLLRSFAFAHLFVVLAPSLVRISFCCFFLCLFFCAALCLIPAMQRASRGDGHHRDQKWKIAPAEREDRIQGTRMTKSPVVHLLPDYLLPQSLCL